MRIVRFSLIREIKKNYRLGLIIFARNVLVFNKQYCLYANKIKLGKKLLSKSMKKGVVTLGRKNHPTEYCMYYKIIFVDR